MTIILDRRTASRDNPFSANRTLYEQQVPTARAGLPEPAFNALWAEGRAMTLEEAIAYALGETT